jgi:hypothetical protein
MPGLHRFHLQFWKLEFPDEYDARPVIVTRGPTG